MKGSSYKKSRGMMLVEDPRETIKAMCAFSDTTLNLYQYKSKYEEIIGRENKPIHIKHAHTHFYSLTSFGFLIPFESVKGLYILSNESKQLCYSLKNSKIDKYQKILRYMLLNNPRKGELFKEFINFIRMKPSCSRSELYIKFKKIPTRSLIAWSKEAGLINLLQDKIWAIEKIPKKEMGLDMFWQLIKETYEELSKSEMLGIEKVFVDIRELTSKICIDLSWTVDEFDQMLRQLLNSKKGEKVRLYGAPTSYFDNKENFFYKGNVYAFIRVMVTENGNYGHN